MGLGVSGMIEFAGGEHSELVVSVLKHDNQEVPSWQ